MTACRQELCRYWPGEGCLAGVMPCDADAPGPGQDPRPVACHGCGVTLSEPAAELGPWCSEACRQGETPL